MFILLLISMKDESRNIYVKTLIYENFKVITLEYSIQTVKILKSCIYKF